MLEFERQGHGLLRWGTGADLGLPPQTGVPVALARLLDSLPTPLRTCGKEFPAPLPQPGQAAALSSGVPGQPSSAQGHLSCQHGIPLLT